MALTINRVYRFSVDQRAFFCFSLFLMAVICSSCSPSPAVPELIPVTVQLSWTHQAQFAGLYAAEQEGYFEEEGLKVSFVEGGPEMDFITPVAERKAEFGVAQPADLILARAAGKPVRSIAVIFRRSPIVFFTLADSGITRPQDFVGKQIRTAVTMDETLQAMMAKAGISPDQYSTAYLPSDIEQFASGEVPIWGGYINVLALEVQKAGYRINIISPDDYGIHFYGDVLISNDDVITNHPDLVQRFMRATLRGWEYAVEKPEQVGVFVQKYNPDLNADLEVEKMIASIPLVNTGEDSVGWMKPEIWKGMEQTLRDQGSLKGSIQAEDVYTMQFLKEIDGQ